MNMRMTWEGVQVRLEFVRFLDGSFVIDAIVDGGQRVARCGFYNGEVLARLMVCIGLGRELGDCNARVAIKNGSDHARIVTALVAADIIPPAGCRTLPSVLGLCQVYELTDAAHAFALHNFEVVDA